MIVSFPSSLLRFFKITVPLAIGLTFILSTGPQVQSYLISFLNSSVPSVYGSAYKDQLIAFPSLGSWVKSSAYWPFFIMSFAIILTATTNTKPRSIIWHVAFSSFIILSIFDIGFSFNNNTLTTRSLSENLIGNFVGSLIIGGLVVSIISLSDFLFVHIPADSFTKTVISGLSPIISGFMFLLLMYYLADLFYNPLSVRLEAHLASPINGAMIFKKKNNPPRDEPDGSLDKSDQSLVPAKAIHSHASWQTAEGQQKIAFNSLSSSTYYQVAITFLSGWCSSEKITKLSSVEPSIKFSDIENGTISFDEGVSLLQILPSESAASKFSVSIKDLSLFWLGQESGTKDMHLTHFLNKGDVVKLVADHKDNTFLLSAPLIGTKAGKSIFATRIFTAKLNKSAYAIRFVPSKTNLSDSVSECKVISAADIEKSESAGFLSINDVKMVSNLLVKITQDDDPKTLGVERTEFVVSGGGGWFKLDSMKADEFENHHVGTLEMMQVRGNINELALDGQPMAARPLSTYTAIGEFTAAYGSGGALMVSGMAKSLWKDDGRLNMTKWEKLAWEPMLFILGLLGTLFLWISTRLVKRLGTNSTFSWLS
jgi:hypothetical protein